MKRIFYSNVNYSCNSNCIFCYSHNTIHNGKRNREISCSALSEYWQRNELSPKDSVIINGGEPLLHEEISAIIASLLKTGCEILLYTNGRLASRLNILGFNSNIRFIVPIHGFRELHDEITGVSGSYDETIDGLHHLADGNCLVDIKIILNHKMVSDPAIFDMTMNSLNNVPFNNTVHITTMADTIVSAKNKCPSVTRDQSSEYTKKAVEHFIGKYRIKLYDTCVRETAAYWDPLTIKPFDEPVIVFFKDENIEKVVDLHPDGMKCRLSCPQRRFCKSAVCEYTVLELEQQKIRITTE